VLVLLKLYRNTGRVVLSSYSLALIYGRLDQRQRAERGSG